MNWDLKYKPLSFEDYIGQSTTKRILMRMSEEIWKGDYNMPHLLFTGGHGVGKTTLAHAFLRHTFGDAWRTNLLEMNSSSENGVNKVRESITTFCKTARIGTYKTPSGEVVDVPYNFAFLDEFDGISREAQYALRRVMEDYPKVRFILSCNYIHKVLKPIQDRCMSFHFTPFTEDDLANIVRRIVVGEGIQIAEDDVRLIAKNSGGSARRAQKLLQKAVLLKSGAAVTTDDIMKNLNILEDKVDSTVLMRILVANGSGDAKGYDAATEEFCDMLFEFQKAGHSGEDVLKMLVRDIKQRDMELEVKKYLTKEIAETLFRGGFTNDMYFFIEMWARSLGSK